MPRKWLMAFPLLAAGVLSANMTLSPTTVVSVKGSVSDQPIDVLSRFEQSGTQNDWDRYLELVADANHKQVSRFVFRLPGDAMSCTSATLRINTLSEPRAYEKWNIRLKNIETRRYEIALQNRDKDWEWDQQSFALDALQTYVDQKGRLQVKVQCSNCSVMDIDALVLSLDGCDNTPPEPPSVSSRYNLQFSQTDALATEGFDVIEIDMEDTDAVTIANLKAQGKTVMCYFSGGSYEVWRSDAASFPPEVLGSALEGWPGESWLDISNLETLLPIMTARMDRAAAKGCDGVDPDNMDGYTNDTGFGLTAGDQLAYNKTLANEAHKRGLLVTLKNDVEQLDELVPYFDMAVNESCYDYDECSGYAQFIAAGKPVHIIEYEPGVFEDTCGSATASGFDMILKNLSLDAYVEQCR